MERRTFLEVLIGGLLVAPFAAGAQQPAPRIALVLSSAPVADVT